MDSDPVLEDLMSQLGDWGRYQFRQHLYHLLGGFLAGLHMLSIVGIAPTPEHRCYIAELDGNGTNFSPSFDINELRDFIPTKDGELEKCFKFDESATNSTIIGCENNFVYDPKYFKESRVIEWDLVCDKRPQRAFIQAFYIFGVLIGAIVLGPLADKLGRKTIFCVSGVLQLFAGLATAFITNYYLYCSVLFFYGAFGSAGSYISGFCLTMELVGPSKRTICGTAFSAAFAVGVMVVAIWGYLITDITILQIVYSLHSLSLFGHWWLIDESIRWLWGQGRTTEAIKIAEKAAKINGREFNKKFDGKLSSASDERSYGISDLFRTPVLRSRAINVSFNWFANSIVYYGLSLNTGSLPGNPFVVLFLIGLAEIPGYFLVIGLVDITGRRSLCSTLMLIGGFACIIVAFIPTGTTVTVIVMLGKLAIAGSFAIIYNYTAELFPTVIRNSAIGVGAMAARFSGMLTPLLGLLDSVDKQLPSVIFGCFAIISGLFTLFLPETLNKQMPQTVEEGERFGIGDTGFRTCFNFFRGQREINEPKEVTERLNISSPPQSP